MLMAGRSVVFRLKILRDFKGLLCPVGIVVKSNCWGVMGVGGAIQWCVGWASEGFGWSVVFRLKILRDFKGSSFAEATADKLLCPVGTGENYAFKPCKWEMSVNY